MTVEAMNEIVDEYNADVEQMMLVQMLMQKNEDMSYEQALAYVKVCFGDLV